MLNDRNVRGWGRDMKKRGSECGDLEVVCALQGADRDRSTRDVSLLSIEK